MKPTGLWMSEIRILRQLTAGVRMVASRNRFEGLIRAIQTALIHIRIALSDIRMSPRAADPFKGSRVSRDGTADSTLVARSRRTKRAEDVEGATVVTRVVRKEIVWISA